MPTFTNYFHIYKSVMVKNIIYIKYYYLLLFNFYKNKRFKNEIIFYILHNPPPNFCIFFNNIVPCSTINYIYNYLRLTRTKV